MIWYTLALALAFNVYLLLLIRRYPEPEQNKYKPWLERVSLHIMYAIDQHYGRTEIKPRKRSDKSWKTREGKVIPIREMEDSHVVNTVAWMRRESKEHFELLRQNFGNDVASEAMARGPAYFFPVYEDMVTELLYRSLEQNENNSSVRRVYPTHQ